MHKKVIKGRVYYYTTKRNGKKTKTVYLGSNRFVARLKELEHKGYGFRNLVLNIVLTFIILGGLTVFLTGTYTGFSAFFATPNTVALEWNDTYDPLNSIVRVSLNNETYDGSPNVINSTIIVNLDLFFFNSTGTGYVDLLVNGTVMDSQTFTIDEVNDQPTIIPEPEPESEEGVAAPQEEVVGTQEEVATTQDETNPPVIDLLVLNASSSTNHTSDNVTAHVETSDLDGDPVKTFFVWKHDNQNLTVLNAPFEGGSNGTFTRDYSPSRRNGTVQSAIWNQTGGYDGRGAYTFSNSSMRINFTDYDGFEIPFGFSLEARFYWQGNAYFGNCGTIINKDSGTATTGYAIEVCNSNRTEFETGDSGAFTLQSGFIEKNRWYHIVATYDGSTKKLYLNGVLNASNVKTINVSFSTGPLDVGRGGFGVNIFNGTIDDVRIYNRALKADQILGLYQNRTNEIVAAETNTKENWTVTAYPNDNFRDGASVKSINLTVLQNKPVITNIILNATDRINETFDNLTVHVIASDQDNNPFNYTYNWYVNGTSITVLNLPFHKINESNTNNTQDYSGFNGTATKNGNPSFTEIGGFDGKGAYEFDASGDYFSFGDQGFYEVGVNLTLEARIKWTGNSITCSSWISKDGGTATMGYHLRVCDSDQKIQFETGDTMTQTLTSNSALIPNNWYHVVATYDGIQKKLYINGEFDGNRTKSGSITFGTGELYVGQGGSGTYPFNGTIDEVRIYDRALTEGQIIALYQNRTDELVSTETVAKENWSVIVYPNDQFEDGEGVLSNFLQVIDLPVTFNLTINSTSINNLTNGNITCSAIISDSFNTTTLKSNVTWYKDGQINFTEQVDVIGEGTLQTIATLAAPNTTRDETWTCSTRAFDGVSYENKSNNVSITINNAPPSQPAQQTPFNNTRTIGNLQSLTCFNSTDIDVLDATNYVFFVGNDTVPSSNVISNSTNTTVAFATTDGLTYNWRCQTHDNTTNSTFSNTFFFVENTNPAINNLSINTTVIQNFTNGSINLAFNVTDADLDSFNTTITWYREGIIQTLLFNETFIHSGNTTKLQNWTAVISATDDHEETNVSATVIIRNAPPEKPAPLSPDNGTRTIANLETITCANGIDLDLDGLTYVQYADNDTIPPTTIVGNSTNSSASFATTDGLTYNWMCQLSDGEDSSAFSNIRNFIENTAPVLGNMTINTTDVNNYTNGTILITYTIFDGDADDVSTDIDWFVDGAYNNTFDNSTTIGSVNTSKGENWTAIVTGFDGFEYAANITATVIIQNSPPPKPDADTPANNVRLIGNSQTISCLVGVDSDGDDVNVVFFADNTSIPPTTVVGNSSIPSATFATTDGLTYNWRCQTHDNTTTDGFSETRSFLENSLPTITDISLLNNDGHNYTNGTLNLSFNLLDNDTDTLTFGIDWYLNGVYNSTFNNLTVIGDGNTTKTDNWTAVVSAFDQYEFAGNATTSTIIVNAPPTEPTINVPQNGVRTVGNVQNLSCTGGSDIDGDTVQHMFFIDNTSIPPTTVIANGTNTTVAFATVDGLTYNWRCQNHDNESNSDFTETRIFQENSRPAIGNFSFQNLDSENHTNGTIKVNFTIADLDADSLVQVIDWFVDGVHNTTFVNLTEIGAGNTTKTDNWTAVVSLFDTFERAINFSSSTIINNTAPTVPTLVTPENDTRTIGNIQTLTCTGSVDTDNDQINYVFFADNTSTPPITLISNTTNTSVAFATEDGGVYHWRCETNDNESDSDFSGIRIFTENSFSTIEGFSLTSSDANNLSNGSLTTLFTLADNDSDSPEATVQWFLDGILNTTFTNITVIGNGNLSRGENWTVVVSAYDGFEFAVNQTAGIQIVNSPPIAPNITNPLGGEILFNNNTITWTLATDSDPIETLSYNLTLHNPDDSVNKSIVTELGDTETSFTLDTKIATDGSYKLNLTATENTSAQRFVASDQTEIFNITNTGVAISLLSPSNGSGDVDGNVVFIANLTNFTIATQCDLILNGTINATKTNFPISEVEFNVTNIPGGEKTWTVNCTNGVQNFSTEIRTLSVLTIPSEYGGNSTDLGAVNISNITNLVFDYPNVGQISYNQNVDLTGIFDLEVCTNISFNRIEIDSDLCSALDGTAELTLHGLEFGTPQILKDDVRCDPSDGCTSVSYNGSTLVFEVDGFTVYSAQETPPEPPSDLGAAPSSSGGGRGIRIVPVVENISIQPVGFIFDLAFEEADTQTLTITNNFPIREHFTLEIQGIQDLVTLDTYDFSIEPGETKEVTLFAVSDRKPGISTGSIIVYGRTEIETLPIVVEISSQNVLFDANIFIPEDYRAVWPGQSIPTHVTLFNIGNPRKVDVKLNYRIVNPRGEVIFEDSETVAVEGQRELEKEFFVPAFAQPGPYILGVEVLYVNSVATATSMFVVREQEVLDLTNRNTIVTVSGVILLLLLVMTIFIMIRYKRRKI